MSLCSLGNMRWVCPLQFPSSIHLYRCIASASSGMGFLEDIMFGVFCGGFYVCLVALLNGRFRLRACVFVSRTSLLFVFPLPCIGLLANLRVV